MYKSGICDTKPVNISETKQSRAKLTTQCLLELVYSLSTGDNAGNQALPVTYVVKVMFSVTAIHQCQNSKLKKRQPYDLQSQWRG